MAIEIKVPQLPESVADATLVTWHKQAGQAVSRDENLADLEEHAADFDAGRGFTYTVLEPVGERVIGCVYLYPDPTAGADVHVRSWVRSSHAHLDAPLWSTVSTWIERDWPFRTVSYAPRDD